MTVQNISIDDKSISPFKKGLHLLMMRFEDSKFNNDYDGMADAIESLKSRIKPRMVNQHREKEVKKIESICLWYRTKEYRYSTNTPEGIRVIFPAGINVIMNHRLSIAYEIIIREMDQLGLL